MFGAEHTYFCDSPVVIDISGLVWPGGSPFNIVRVEILHDGNVVGDFRKDSGGQTSISFDISTALRAIWREYDFGTEVTKATSALTASVDNGQEATRSMKSYSLRIYTEYLLKVDGEDIYTVTQCEDSSGDTDISGGQCLIGGYTEWERDVIMRNDDTEKDVSALEHTGVRNGDASTKPTSTPERVGRNSITSWVDVKQGQHRCIYYNHAAQMTEDDVTGRETGWGGHAPLVLRDTADYTDFLFVNRRGAVETASAQMLESLSIPVEKKTYARIGRPSFAPTRSIASRATGGRRSWAASSGHQTREWAEWWTMEFLMARRHWMRYQGVFVPVVVEPAKKENTIYDRSKQQMPSVEFTVTLALEG